MAELHPDNPYTRERFADPQREVEFPPEAMRKYEAILERYPTKQAALIPTLHLAQETFGWISPETMLYVAGLLEQTPASVFGVVSFYDMFNQKPPGRHYLKVCTNLSCMLRDAYGIYEHLCEKLGVHPGHNTPDGRFTVGEVECLGSCGTAPVVQVNNAYHEDMSIEKVDQLLEKLK